jgi:predicted flap endonuclease-1-like 5' DNA nuclease
MSFLLSNYFGWIVAAFVLGAVTGWMVASRGGGKIGASLLLIAIGAFVLALWSAFAHLLPGRTGHALEIVLMLLVPWLFGCALGAPLRHAIVPAPAQRPAPAQEQMDGPTAAPFASLAAVTSAPAVQAGLSQSASAQAQADLFARSRPPLSAIANIGVVTEQRLAALGVSDVASIAEWDAEDAALIGERVGDPGVVEREMWIPQARLLSAGVETSYSTAHRMARAGGVTSAPLDATRLGAFRHELEDLAESAGVNAFSFAPPRTADALREADARAGELVSDEHKPLLLAAPPQQGADDLKLIWGVGPKLEAMLNEMGVYRFDQIASWNEMNLRWVDQNLKAFKGRAVRDRWIDQSKKLAEGWRPKDAVGDKFEG